MIRNALIVLTLFSQALAAFGRPALILCVHESGRSSIEYRWATCCKGDDTACMARLGSNEDSPCVHAGESCEAEDPCTDSAWSADEILSRTPSSIPLTAEAHPVLTSLDIPAAVHDADVQGNVWPTELPLALGPPTFLRTIVLIV